MYGCFDSKSFLYKSIQNILKSIQYIEIVDLIHVESDFETTSVISIQSSEE